MIERSNEMLLNKANHIYPLPLRYRGYGVHHNGHKRTQQTLRLIIPFSFTLCPISISPNIHRCDQHYYLA